MKPMRMSDWIAAALVVLLSAGVLAGCGSAQSSDQNTASPKQNRGYTEPTQEIKKQAANFHWEQNQTVTGAKEEVAESVKYFSYFSVLRGRDGLFIQLDAKPYVDTEFWDVMKTPRDAASSRGPVTVRLMDVTIDDGTAYTVSCVDQHQQQLQPQGSDTWKSMSRDYVQQNHRFTRSPTSPTGWVYAGSHNGNQSSPTPDCQKSLFDRAADVGVDGPLEIPDAP